MLTPQNRNSFDQLLNRFQLNFNIVDIGDIVELVTK